MAESRTTPSRSKKQASTPSAVTPPMFRQHEKQIAALTKRVERIEARSAQPTANATAKRSGAKPGRRAKAAGGSTV